MGSKKVFTDISGSYDVYIRQNLKVAIQAMLQKATKEDKLLINAGKVICITYKRRHLTLLYIVTDFL